MLGAIGGAIAWLCGGKPSTALDSSKKKPRYIRCRVKLVESQCFDGTFEKYVAQECWEYSEDGINWYEGA